MRRQAGLRRSVRFQVGLSCGQRSPTPPPSFPAAAASGFRRGWRAGGGITCARPWGRLVRRQGRNRALPRPGWDRAGVGGSRKSEERTRSGVNARWPGALAQGVPPIPGPVLGSGARGVCGGGGARSGHELSAAHPQGLLQPGGDQDYLGGARGVPGPAARGLGRLWRRLVSAGRAGWPAVRPASWRVSGRVGPALPLSRAPRSSAVDSRTGAKVAIKKLYRPFQSELFAKRAYRELRLLKHMRHENVSCAGPRLWTPVRRLCSPSCRKTPGPTYPASLCGEA